jgi:uncharacterized OsmC-like protein
MSHSPVIIAERQALLAKTYTQNSSKALITDSASTHANSTNLSDPLHSSVTAGGFDIPVAVHCAVGGESDGAVPGDLLCAALASCLDSTLRIIANRLRLNLLSLEVRATADIDVRGTLCIDSNVAVGFQKMHLSASLAVADDVSHKLINALFQGAEHSCVVFQTLKLALPITTQFHSNIKPLQAKV